MEIKNIDRLNRKLMKLPKVNFLRVMKEVVGDVQSTSKLLSPVDTGTLRNSLHTRVRDGRDKIVGDVFTNLNYAVYVEFGTGQRGSGSGGTSPYIDVSYNSQWAGMVAQPYLYPAITQERPNILRKFSDELNEYNKKVAGGTNV